MNPSDPLTSPDSGDSEDIFKSTFKVLGSFVKEVETKGKGLLSEKEAKNIFLKFWWLHATLFDLLIFQLRHTIFNINLNR